MKLLVTGLVLLAAATVLLFVPSVDPAPLFLGVIDLISRPGGGPAVSAGDVSEAQYLANLRNYGSVDRSARLIDR